MIQVANKSSEVIDLDESIHLQELGIYKRHFNYRTSEEYNEALKDNIERQKWIAKEKIGLFYNPKGFVLNGSKRDGTKIINEYAKNMVAVFNACCDNWIEHITAFNYDKTIEAMKKKFDKLNTVGKLLNVEIGEDFLRLRQDEAYIRFEMAILKEQEKEEKARQKEVLREQEKAEKEMLQQKEKIEKELEHFKKEYELSHDQNVQDKIEELNSIIEACDYRLFNNRAGYLYIISNDDMLPETYKIGVTRRLDPMVRIAELSNASHAYKFKVHGMIFNDDVFNLESNLHKHFAYCRLNQPNPHKEFFKVSLKEIEMAISEQTNKSVVLDSDIYNEDYILSKALLNDIYVS